MEGAFTENTLPTVVGVKSRLWWAVEGEVKKKLSPVCASSLTEEETEGGGRGREKI